MMLVSYMVLELMAYFYLVKAKPWQSSEIASVILLGEQNASELAVCYISVTREQDTLSHDFVVGRYMGPFCCWAQQEGCVSK